MKRNMAIGALMMMEFTILGVSSIPMYLGLSEWGATFSLITFSLTNFLLLFVEVRR